MTKQRETPWEAMDRMAATGRARAEDYLDAFPDAGEAALEAVSADAAIWERDFAAYDASLGGALQRIGEQPQDIQGRDRELPLLVEMLERPRTPVVMLLGAAGSGKTALVQEFVRRANDGSTATLTPHTYMPVSLRLGQLSALDNDAKQAALANILPTLASFEARAQRVLGDPSLRIVLFIDEAHMLVTIFGEGTKIGGDVMKDKLSETPIRVIAATTRREWDSTIAPDKPLAERFKVIELREVGPDVVSSIARNWWERVAPDCPVPDEGVVDTVIRYNAAYRPDSAEPRKTLDILEDLVSWCRRTGDPATVATVDDVFRKRFLVDPKFSIDGEAIYRKVREAIKGQPYAMNMIHLILAGTSFINDFASDRPIFSALFTGPTGVGKTETTKVIARNLYPDGGDHLFVMNMPDYAGKDAEPTFRKVLGEHISHEPNTVVLVDEFEKAHPDIRNTLLQILDEGIVNYMVVNREGRQEARSASLRNAAVVCTTNAGSKVFRDDAEFGRSSTEGIGGRMKPEETMDEVEQAQVDRLLDTLYDDLARTKKFTPELLGRFDAVVPYRSLPTQTTVDILERELHAYIDRFRDVNGIEVDVMDPVRWDPNQYNVVADDVCAHIAFKRAKITNSDAGGARALAKYLRTDFFYPVVRAVTQAKGCTRFRVHVPGAYEVPSPGPSVWRLDLENQEGIKVEPVYD